MNLDNGLYVFNGIPGVDASKGERISRAFQKLNRKVNHLEQARLADKKSSLKPTLTCKEEDVTMEDVQYMLLSVQLRFVRSLLKNLDINKDETENVAENTSGSNTRMKSILQDFQSSVNEIQHAESGNCDITPDISDKEVQTSTSLMESFLKVDNAEETDQILSGTTEPRMKNHAQLAHRGSHAAKHTSSSHYHLKLDDVPFILGGSSSASHSVIANIQSIIGKMKQHNKALCGHRGGTSAVERSQAPTAISKTYEMQDANQMLQEITSDLSKLTQKHKKLEKMIDVHQVENPKFKSTDKGNKKSEVSTEFGKKANAEETASSSSGLQPKSKHIKPKERCSGISRLPHQINPQATRCKLMRSLQDFKSHLEEDDVLWQ